MSLNGTEWRDRGYGLRSLRLGQNRNRSDTRHTDKKETQISFIYKEIQTGAVAKSYMRKGFLIYEEMRKYIPISKEAVSHIWLCNCSILNFHIFEENFLSFLSVQVLEFRNILYLPNRGTKANLTGPKIHNIAIKKLYFLVKFYFGKIFFFIFRSCLCCDSDAISKSNICR